MLATGGRSGRLTRHLFPAHPCITAGGPHARLAQIRRNGRFQSTSRGSECLGCRCQLFHDRRGKESHIDCDGVICALGKPPGVRLDIDARGKPACVTDVLGKLIGTFPDRIWRSAYWWDPRTRRRQGNITENAPGRLRRRDKLLRYRRYVFPGESEILIGKAFRKRRDKVFIATKGGYCLPARNGLIQFIKPLAKPIVRAIGLRRHAVPAVLAGRISQDFSPAYLRKAVEASLRRLQSDYIDLYQIHSPPREELLGTQLKDAPGLLACLKAEGKTPVEMDSPSTPSTMRWIAWTWMGSPACNCLSG